MGLQILQKSGSHTSIRLQSKNSIRPVDLAPEIYAPLPQIEVLLSFDNRGITNA